MSEVSEVGRVKDVLARPNAVQGMINEFMDAFASDENDTEAMAKLGVFAIGYAAGYRVMKGQVQMAMEESDGR